MLWGAFQGAFQHFREANLNVAPLQQSNELTNSKCDQTCAQQSFTDVQATTEAFLATGDTKTVKTHAPPLYAGCTACACEISFARPPKVDRSALAEVSGDPATALP